MTTVLPSSSVGPLPPNQSLLDILSTDIILLILSISTPTTLRRCQMVCRFLRDLIRLDTYLQYLLELDTCGYTEPLNPRRDLSYDEKIALLRDHTSRWRNPGIISPNYYELPPGRTIGARPFVQGTLAWQAETDKENDLISFYQLPSRNRGTEFKHWSLDMAEFRDFESLWTDPEQDLLVVVMKTGSTSGQTTYELHLRSMATKQVHPMVKKEYSVLIYSTILESLRVEVVGRSLATISTSFAPSVVDAMIWDWMSGQERTHLLYEGSSQLELISEGCFVVAEPSTLGSPSNSPGQLQVYLFDMDPIATPAPATHIASFELPPSAGEDASSEIKLHLAPNTSATMGCMSAPKVYDQPAHESLLRIEILARPKYFFHGTRALGIIYAPVSTLTDSVSSASFGVTNAQACLNIPWDEWGHQTSWSADTESGGNCCIRMSGRRVVTAKKLLVDKLPDLSIFGFYRRRSDSDGSIQPEKIAPQTEHQHSQEKNFMNEVPMWSLVKTRTHMAFSPVSSSSTMEWCDQPWVDEENGQCCWR